MTRLYVRAGPRLPATCSRTRRWTLRPSALSLTDHSGLADLAGLDMLGMLGMLGALGALGALSALGALGVLGVLVAASLPAPGSAERCRAGQPGLPPCSGLGPGGPRRPCASIDGSSLAVQSSVRLSRPFSADGVLRPWREKGAREAAPLCMHVAVDRFHHLWELGCTCSTERSALHIHVYRSLLSSRASQRRDLEFGVDP